MITLLLVEHQQSIELFISDHLSVSLLPKPAATLVLVCASGVTAYITFRWELKESRCKFPSQFRMSFSTVFGSADDTASAHTLTPSA